MSAEFDPLVVAWADDLFLHGVHLARWIVDYVDLEESLAVGTLAQEQLAHARELLTAAGLDAAERDRHLYDRPAADWAPSRLAADPIEEWPQVVAVGLLLTHGSLAMLAEADAADATDAADAAEAADAGTADAGTEEGGAARVAGIVSEQRLHLMHWQRWTGLLAGSSTTRESLLGSLHWAGELAGDLLGGLAEDDHSDEHTNADAHGDWPPRARQRFRTDLAASMAAADVPAWTFEVSAPRRRGEHATLIEPVLSEQRCVRARYPDPVLEPR